MSLQQGLYAATQPATHVLRKQVIQRIRQHRRKQHVQADMPACFVADQTGTLPATSGAALGSTPVGGNEPPRNVTYRSLFRNPNFRLLWLGETVSTFGSMFTRLAIPVYVITLTSSYRQLGLAVFWGLVASLVFGLVSGVFVDRWNRRNTMVAVSAVNGVLLVALVSVVLWNPALPVQLPAIYALNFVTALLRDLFAAARVAIFPEVLTEDEYLVANTLDQSTTQFAELLSYPLAILVFWLGPILAFSLDAVSFFVAALLLWRVRTTPVPVEKEGKHALLHDLAAGLRTTWRLPLVRSIVLLSFIVPLVFSLMFTLQIPYAVDVAGSTEKVGFPLLEGAMAIGFMIGAVLLGRSGAALEPKHTAGKWDRWHGWRRGAARAASVPPWTAQGNICDPSNVDDAPAGGVAGAAVDRHDEQLGSHQCSHRGTGTNTTRRAWPGLQCYSNGVGGRVCPWRAADGGCRRPRAADIYGHEHSLDLNWAGVQHLAAPG